MNQNNRMQSNKCWYGGRGAAALAVAIGLTVCGNSQPALAQQPEKKPSAVAEKLLTRTELEAKYGAPVVTSREIGEVMKEFNGLSLDEFSDLLGNNGLPKDKAAFDRVQDALLLTGNKATGLEEAYQIIVPDGGLKVVAVDTGSPGEKIGLKPGTIINSWWVEVDEILKTEPGYGPNPNATDEERRAIGSSIIIAQVARDLVKSTAALKTHKLSVRNLRLLTTAGFKDWEGMRLSKGEKIGNSASLGDGDFSRGFSPRRLVINTDQGILTAEGVLICEDLVQDEGAFEAHREYLRNKKFTDRLPVGNRPKEPVEPKPYLNRQTAILAVGKVPYVRFLEDEHHRMDSTGNHTVESLLGIRLHQKYKRKTQLSKAEFETAKGNLPVPPYADRETRKESFEAYDHTAHSAALNLSQSSPDAGALNPTALRGDYQYAIPALDCVAVQKQLANVGSGDSFWPLETYWKLRNAQQFKDVSFALYQQKGSDTWAFYSGEQAVLVIEIRDLKFKDSDIIALMTAHPEVVDNLPARPFCYFPYEGGLHLLVRDDSTQKAVTKLFGQKKDGTFRTIDVSDIVSKLPNEAMNATSPVFMERFQWLNNGESKKTTSELIANSAPVEAGSLGGQELGIGIHSKIVFECLGDNYLGRMFSADDQHIIPPNIGGPDKELRAWNSYVFLFGKTSLMKKMLKEGGERDSKERIEQYNYDRMRMQEWLKLRKEIGR